MGRATVSSRIAHVDWHTDDGHATCRAVSFSEEDPRFTRNTSLTLRAPLRLRSPQGRVRTKTVKKAARNIVEKYYSRLTMDFQTNKKMADEVAIIPTKRLRNKIAGFMTRLMRRIARGPVRGISLKLQEEERERRMDFVPEVSALEVDTLEVDPETKALLRHLDFANINVSLAAAPGQRRGGGGDRGPRPDRN